jgi:energy-coupling factor transporter ATP-binding protein EcfA2
MQRFKTDPIEDVQLIKGIAFPSHVTFRQLLITGPPGAGKSTMLRRLGGWSEEGYIDLSINKWWTAQSLSLRPREIHLGLPFVGHKQALAVFEKAWIETETPLQIDFERIRIPPAKKHFFSVNWHNKYVFEFLVPSSKTLLRRRVERSKRGTHPVDIDLDRQIIERQVDAYRQIALFLFQQGISVYLRDDIDSLPLRIIELE